MSALTFARHQWTEADMRKLILGEIVYLRPDPDLDDLVGMDDPAYAKPVGISDGSICPGQ